MMGVDATVTRVWEIATPVVAEAGMEILEIQFRPGGRGRHRVLRLYLDKEGGPTLDDLTRVSRQLSDLLDLHTEIGGSYTLEVSSPGVNRLLKKREHFDRFVGKKVRVRTREAIEGRRSFLGMLHEAREDAIVILQERREFQIPFSVIERANYEHDWGD